MHPSLCYVNSLLLKVTTLVTTVCLEVVLGHRDALYILWRILAVLHCMHYA